MTFMTTRSGKPQQMNQKTNFCKRYVRQYKDPTWIKDETFDHKEIKQFGGKNGFGAPSVRSGYSMA